MEVRQFLEQADIVQLQNAYKEGSLTVQDVVATYLEKIEQENTKLGAVICTGPNAMTVARSLDSSRDFSLPLFGVPILIKDNIETRDMPTTAGSLILEHNDTGRDAPVVSALRNAGAVILGKANLSEWANFRARASTSGWSAIGGQCRNPHNHDCSPSGSSSGSASAVAARLCMGAVGTETLGSIISPAAACGVVGIKPSINLLSQRYIVPISHSQDTPGPIANSASDAARILSCMADGLPDYASLDDKPDWSEKRAGVIPFTLGFNAEVDKLFHSIIAKLKGEGAAVIEDLIPAVGFEIGEYSREISLFEFKHNLNAYLEDLPNDYSKLTLQKIIELNAQSTEELKYFGQDIFEAAQAKGAITDQDYLDTIAKLHDPARAAVDELFEQNTLDFLLAPTMGPALPIDYETGDKDTGGNFLTAIAAITGYPHITLPMGRLDDLPVGLSLMGLKHSEASLVQHAIQIEKLIGS
jgi:amidase